MKNKRPPKLTVSIAMTDLEKHLRTKGFSITAEALEFFQTAERISFEHNYAIFEWVYLAALLKMDSEVRSLLMRNGCDPDAGFDACLEEIRGDQTSDGYDDSSLYSGGWRGSGRSGILDWCMTLSSERNSHEITRWDFIGALLQNHDEWAPLWGNGQWTDERLSVPYNTLSHVLGTYDKNLWLKFDLIRTEFGLFTGAETRRGLIESAPKHIRSFLLDLLSDHPNYSTNCFLIMPFRESAFHKAVRTSVTRVLSEYGVHALRADDRSYSNDVFSNIETYMCGCRFAVAVHERTKSDEHNPNVALEAGYMRGQGKDVCLLKEKTVKSLPSDLQGQLYVEFDGEAIEDSIDVALRRWLIDKRIIGKR